MVVCILCIEKFFSVFGMLQRDGLQRIWCKKCERGTEIEFYCLGQNNKYTYKNLQK